MKIIEANAKILKEEDFSSIYSFVEYVGRTCYKSTDHITNTSGLMFVKNLVKSRHLAMLEHAIVYLKTDASIAHQMATQFQSSAVNPGRHIIYTYHGKDCYISTSFRSIIELIEYKDTPMAKILVTEVGRYYSELFKNLLENNEGFVGPSEFKVLTRERFIKDVTDNSESESERCRILRRHLTYTMLFTCDRGVSHELVRHRVASFAQESTRYCNYSKDKFGSEITVIKPCTLEEHTEEYEVWKKACVFAEKAYFQLLDCGVKPQMARDVLPTSLKTEIVVTATEEEWQHIINLRLTGTTGAPHPQMKEIMEIAYPLLHEASDNRL